MSTCADFGSSEGPSSVVAEQRRTQKNQQIVNGDPQRNRRMLANIQSALGGPQNSAKPRKTKVQSKAKELAFDNLSQMLERMRLADTNVEVSLSDIRPYLMANEKSLTDDELQILCKTFCESALMQTNSYYVVGLCVDLCKNRNFMVEMSAHLRAIVENFIIAEFGEEEDGAVRALPDFLAQLAMTKWPRGHDKAIELYNPILAAISCTVVGWIELISNCASAKDFDNIETDDLKILERCVEAVYTFCMVGQRSIWMNFPEIFDKVYEATSSLLTSNLALSRSLKASFLQLHLLLNKWSASNTKKFSSVSTQTIAKF